MSTEQPRALRLAAAITASGQFTQLHLLDDASAELRRQHARITELESHLEAVGAGGVSGPLLGTQASSGFDACDMATASAQGFRDGQASQAQPVGAVPAATVRVHNKGGAGEFRTLEGIDALEDGTQLYTAPKPAAQALDARIRNAGGTLANAAFNLSQQGGQVLEERAAKTLKKLQVEWDAAIAAKQGDV